MQLGLRDMGKGTETGISKILSEFDIAIKQSL